MVNVYSPLLLLAFLGMVECAFKEGVATGHNVRHAGVISPELIVIESVGVVNLIRCCSSIDGVVSSTIFGCVLPDIDDSHDFVKKSVGVPGFTGCLISIGWAGRGVYYYT